MLGDMLSSALGIIGFSWNGSPAATELETVRQGAEQGHVTAGGFKV